MTLALAVSRPSIAAIELFVKPDCPSPADQVMLVAYAANGPLLGPEPLSVERIGNTIKVVAVAIPIASPAPPAQPLNVPVGNLAVGAYEYRLYTRLNVSGNLGTEEFQGTKQFEVVVAPPPCTPAVLRIAAGNSQVAKGGASYASAIQIIALDSQGRGVPGLNLHVSRLAPPAEYAIGEPLGTVVLPSAVEIVTDASGTASLLAIAGQVPGAIQYAIRWTQGITSLRAFANFGVVNGDGSGAIPVVEYEQEHSGSFFVSSSLVEMAVLDESGIPGWQRTGGTWLVFSSPALLPEPAKLPVCRFYSSSWNAAHFLSVFQEECDALSQEPSWYLESAAVFGAIAPTDIGCPPGSRPIYRTVRFELPTGHRYTDSLQLANHEVMNGAVMEGRGQPATAMCGPN